MYHMQALPDDRKRGSIKDDWHPENSCAIYINPNPYLGVPTNPKYGDKRGVKSLGRFCSKN